MLCTTAIKLKKELALRHSLVGSQASGVQVALDSLPPSGPAGARTYAAVAATRPPHCPPTHPPFLQRSAEKRKRKQERLKKNVQTRDVAQTVFSASQEKALRHNGKKQSRLCPIRKSSRCGRHVDHAGLGGETLWWWESKRVGFWEHGWTVIGRQMALV